MFQHGALEFILLGVCWASWICRFIRLRRFFSHYFFKYASFPFPSSYSGTRDIYVSLLDVSGVRQAYSLFILYLSAPQTWWFQFLSLSSLILSSACSRVLLDPSGKLYILDIVLFSPRISVLFLIIYFSLYSCFVHISFSWFLLVLRVFL